MNVCQCSRLPGVTNCRVGGRTGRVSGVFGAIQVLRNSGGGVSTFPGKSFTKV